MSSRLVARQLRAILAGGPPPLGESRSLILISFSHEHDEHADYKDPPGSLMLIVCSSHDVERDLSPISRWRLPK